MRRHTWEDKEPEFNPLDYNGSLLATLKFFNSEVDDDLKKEWSLDYWKDQGKSTAYFDKINSASFAQLGVLIRLKCRGFAIDPNHENFINSEYEKLCSRVKKPKEVKEHKPEVKEVVDKTISIAHEMCADIDAEFDQISEFGVRKYDIKNHLYRSKHLFAISDILIKRYEPKLKELEMAISGSDKQIKEGYSQYSKKDLRMMCEFAQSIISACSSAKPIVKTRKKKVITIDKLVSKVKYLKEFQPLQMKSIAPDRIIGAKVVYLFNVKVNKLFKCVALDGNTLTIKVSVIQNLNSEKSVSKTIRKPEQFIQGVNSIPNRNFDSKFDSLEGFSGRSLGKITEDIVILKVY